MSGGSGTGHSYDPHSIVEEHYQDIHRQVDQQLEGAAQLVANRALSPQRPYPIRPKNRVSSISTRRKIQFNIQALVLNPSRTYLNLKKHKKQLSSSFIGSLYKKTGLYHFFFFVDHGSFTLYLVES